MKITIYGWSISLNPPRIGALCGVLAVRSCLAVAGRCIQKVSGLSGRTMPLTRRNERLQRSHRWIQAKVQARRIGYLCGDLETRRVRLNDLRRDVGVWPTRAFRCGAAPFSGRKQLYEDYERQANIFMTDVQLALQATVDFKTTVEQLPERRRSFGDDLARQVRAVEEYLLRITEDEAHILMGEVYEPSTGWHLMSSTLVVCSD